MKTILVHPAYFPSIKQMAAIAQAQKVRWEVCDNFQKQTYRNRMYIAHSNGKLLLSVPLKRSKGTGHQKTSEVLVENDFPWQSLHWKSLQSAYRSSPFFEFYEDDLKPFFFEPVRYMLSHNLRIFKILAELLGLEVKESKTTSYEKNPEIIDFRFLADAKRQVNFEPEPYIQVLEESHGFIPNLSVLDLLFNLGPDSLNYLQNQKLKF